jgi:hypothetical protein
MYVDAVKERTRNAMAVWGGGGFCGFCFLGQERRDVKTPGKTSQKISFRDRSRKERFSSTCVGAHKVD